MIAVAVLGTALFVLLETHYAAMRAQDELRNEVLLRNLTAQAVGIAEVEVVAGNHADSQEFGKRYPGFKYAFEAQPVDEQNYPGLYDAMVTVEGPEDVRRELHVYVMTSDLMAAAAGPPAPEGEDPPETPQPDPPVNPEPKP